MGTQPGKPKRKKKKSKAKAPAKKSSKKKKAAPAAAAAADAAAPSAAVEVKATKSKKKVDNIAGTAKNGATGMFATSFKGDKNDDEGWEQVKTKPKAEKPVVEESKEDENLVTEKINVNNIGRLTGKQGATINEIRTLSGATIAIPEKGSNSKQVIVKGSADEVQNAIDMIKQEIGDDASNAPAYSTTIVVNNIGRLIGTGGKTIQSLTKDGVKIDTPKQRKGAGNIVTVSGPSKEVVDKTIGEIKEVIGDDDPAPQVTKNIAVQAQYRSLIIGRGGETTVNKLQSESGAKIVFARKGSNEAGCRLSGTAEQIAAAKKLIDEIKDKAKAQEEKAEAARAAAAEAADSKEGEPASAEAAFVGINGDASVTGW